MANDAEIRFGAVVGDAIANVKRLGDTVKQTLGEVPGAATKATGAVTGMARGFEQAAGSVFTLRNAITGLALYEVTRGVTNLATSVIGAGMKMQELSNRMRASVGDAGIAAQGMKFVQDESERLGLRFVDAAEGFASFSASALRAGLTLDETKRVFTGVSEAAAALGISAERQKLVFMALSQMASKGTVSMEELRQQLGENLPGALHIFAASMGVSTAQFIKMVEAGEVLAPNLVKLGDEMHRQFGERAVEASRNAQGEINRLQNAIFSLQAQAADSGPMDTFTQSIRSLTDLLRDPATLDGLREFVGLLAKLVEYAIKAASAVGSVYNAVNNGIERAGNAVFGMFGGGDALAVARAYKTTYQQNMGNDSKLADADKLLDAIGGTYTLGKENRTAGPASKSGKGGAGKGKAGEWEAELRTMLMAQQKFGKDADDVELKYWQQKLVHARKGTGDYNAITGRVYAIQERQANERARHEKERADEVLQHAKQNLAQLQNAYRMVYGRITDNFNNSLRGMLNGTATFGSMVRDMLTDMLFMFIEVVERMVIEWAIAEHTKGAASKVAALQDAVIKGEYARVAVATDAAAAYAGVFANLAPYLGPAAAGPATAAYGNVMAMQAAIPSFDVGTWSVPNNMLANIHQGEMIIPKTFADSLRENGGLGGGGTNVTINAVDARSVANLLRSNSNIITGIVGRQARNNDKNLQGVRG